MNAITSITAQQLRKAADLKERIERLEHELNQLLGGGKTAVSEAKPKVQRSAAWRKALSESMKARWAARKRQTGAVRAAAEPKNKKQVSDAKLKALAKARAARWAKFRAAKNARR
jgi:hypothetical protein